MKVIVICEDHSTFEFSSVFIYPFYDPSADAEKRHQIRISHGTVFSGSQQDYAIYKCGSELLRIAVHAILNRTFERCAEQSDSETRMIFIHLREIIKEAAE